MGGAASKPKLAHEVRIILLGSPGVGKSTVFKQLTLLYRNDGFPPAFMGRVRPYVLEAMALTQLGLLSYAREANLELSAELEAKGVALSELAQRLHQEVLQSEREGLLDQPAAAASAVAVAGAGAGAALALMRSLAAEPALQAARGAVFAQGKQDALVAKHREALPETGQFFIDRLGEIGTGEEYVPSTLDLLYLRRSTTEATAVSFDYTTSFSKVKEIVVPVTCIDVGGQSEHERDWAAHGQNATAVVYVMCISDFDLVTEKGMNKLKESLSLLRSVVQSPVFAGKKLIVLFNKMDVIEDKLKRCEFRHFFTTFQGDNTVPEVTAYFRERVRQLVEASAREVGSPAVSLTIVESCAVNTTLMQSVLTAILVGLYETAVKHMLGDD